MYFGFPTVQKCNIVHIEIFSQGCGEVARELNASWCSGAYI